MVTLFILLSLLFCLSNSQIKVLEPTELAKQFRGFSNFGHFDYGQIVHGRLYYDPNNDGCINYPEYFFHDTPIVMADGCDWAKKVKNIQHGGGQMVIIYLDYSTPFINEFFFQGDDNNAFSIWSSTSNINIPSMIMNRDDAKIIQNYYAKNQKNYAVFEVDFTSKSPDDTISMEMFASVIVQNIKEVAVLNYAKEKIII